MWDKFWGVVGFLFDAFLSAIVCAMVGGFFYMVYLHCAGRPEPDWRLESEERIENVGRVMAYTNHHYVVLSESGTELVWRDLNATPVTGPVKLIRDVAKDQPMWAAVRVERDHNHSRYWGGYRTRQWVEIHIRSERDVVGGERVVTVPGKPPRTERMTLLAVE